MRKIAIMLLLSMLALAACSSGELPVSGDTMPPSDTESVETSPYNKYGDLLPETLDYEGYEFRVLTYTGGNLTDAWACYIEIEAENGTTLNDAAYRRSIEVEDRLNIAIKVREDAPWGGVVGQLEKTTLAGQDEYDYAIPPSTEVCTGLVSQKALLPFNELEGINLDADYYNPTANSAFAINGKYYFLFGDMTYPLMSSVYLIFNKDMLSSLGLQSPYDMIFDGKWTFDALMEYVTGVYQDVNGNGKTDTADIYGMNTNSGMPIYFFHSMGGRSVELNSEGKFDFVLYNERTVDIMNKILRIYDNSDVEITDWTPFFENKTLFCYYGSSLQREEFRTMEFEFGFTPSPKYDEAQEKYENYLAGGLTLVPVTVADTERTGTIIEAMQSASHRYIIDAFIDTYVEQKVLRDEESKTVYRLIMGDSTCDFTRYIDPSGKLQSYSLVLNLFKKKSSDLASAWAAAEVDVKKSYEDFYELMAN